MSFLAGRLAGKEGAYFYQESKHAVGRLIEKTKPNSNSTNYPGKQLTNTTKLAEDSSADILPEILRHSLPSNIFRQPSESSLSAASKWALPSDPKTQSFVSSEALNPLRAYVSLPQVTFGPKRWELPRAENSFIASTANDSRHDKYTPINPQKLKDAAVGLSQIAKAFAAATAIVFGGATLLFALVASKLELHTIDDIRTKGKDLVNSRFEMVKEQATPLRTWVDGTSKKWHFERREDIKDKPLIRELSKKLGAKTSS